MKRLALTALALASTALSGAAFADDYYNQGDNYRSGYEYNSRNSGIRYDMARVISVDPIIDNGYSQARRECWVEPSRSRTRYNNRSYNNQYSNNNYNNNYRQSYNGGGNNTGAVLGGVIGAALGNQIGDGDGRRAATAVGAVLGYAITRDMQNNRGGDNRYSDNRYSDNRYNNQYDYRNDRQSNGYYTEPNGRLRCRMVNDGRHDYGYSQNNYQSHGNQSYGNDRYGRDRYLNERYQDRYNHDRYDNRYDNARVTGYRVSFEYQGRTYSTVTDYHPGSNIRVRVNVIADGNEVGYNDRDNRYTRY